MMLPEEILINAAEYMETHGKVSGTYSDYTGAVCAMGAMRMVAFGHADKIKLNYGNFKEYCEAENMLKNQAGTAILTSWSDCHSKAQVIQAFRAAALDAEWKRNAG